MKIRILIFTIISVISLVGCNEGKANSEKEKDIKPKLVGLLAIKKGGTGILYNTKGEVINKKMKAKHIDFVEFEGSSGRPGLFDFLPGASSGKSYNGRSKKYKPYKDIEPQHLFMYSFSEGLAGISMDREKYGYIDITGKFVIEPKYAMTTEFSEGLAKVYLTEYDELKTGFINKKGEMLIGPFSVSKEDYHPFSDGLALMIINDKDGNQYKDKYGYIDKNGKIVIEAKFDHAKPFHKGFAIVGIRENEHHSDIKLGLINKNGEYLIEPKYDNLSVDEKGTIRYTDKSSRKGSEYAIINEKGEIKYNLGFSEISSFNEGLAVFTNSDYETKFRESGFIDITGKVIIEPKFSYAHPFSEGLAYVSVNNPDLAHGFIDKTGNFILPPIPHKYGHIYNDVKEGMIVFCGDNFRWGVMDKTAKLIVEPNNYKKINDFSDGLATVVTGNTENGIYDKTGIIDKNGNSIIETEFEKIYRIYEFNEDFINNGRKNSTRDEEAIITNKSEIIIMEQAGEKYIIYK